MPFKVLSFSHENDPLTFDLIQPGWMHQRIFMPRAYSDLRTDSRINKCRRDEVQGRLTVAAHNRSNIGLNTTHELSDCYVGLRRWCRRALTYRITIELVLLYTFQWTIVLGASLRTHRSVVDVG